LWLISTDLTACVCPSELTAKTLFGCPFDEVMEQCNKIIKEYYSCFPFLLSMIQLLLNHSTLAKTEDTKKEILQQCILLSQRVKLSLHMMEPVLFEQIYSQGIQIFDSFQMKEIITNAVFGIHIVAAQGYLLQQEKEKALNQQLKTAL